ncbi:MAG: SRPBCC domain-containing protein [Sporichthyaceae bacterium]
MGFPDRIARTVEIAAPPARVWAAITTAEGLAAWFGDTASIDLRPGGAMAMTFGESHTATMRVEHVDPPTTFAFTWSAFDTPEDDPRRTFVEFTLEPLGAGTRLTVVETGFAQLPDAIHKAAYDSHTEGWQREIDELVAYAQAS